MKKVILNQTGEKIQEDLNFTEKLFAQYSSESVYNKGDLVRHDDRVYRCNVNNTSGDWNASKWTSVSINELLNTKVDKIEGKGLSTNDFTNEEKEKLNNHVPVVYDARPYMYNTLPSSILDVLKVGDIVICDHQLVVTSCSQPDGYINFREIEIDEDYQIIFICRYLFNEYENQWEYSEDDEKSYTIGGVNKVNGCEPLPGSHGDVEIPCSTIYQLTTSITKLADTSDGRYILNVCKSGDVLASSTIVYNITKFTVNDSLSVVFTYFSGDDGFYDEILYRKENNTWTFDGSYEYSYSSVIPNPTLSGNENKLTSIKIDVRKYAIPLLDKIISTTYAELKTLRDNSQLVPGQQYRITDYVTTTIQPRTQSAGHQFDVIVVADDVDKINENARACDHISSPIYDVTFADDVTKKCYVYFTGEDSFNVVAVDTLLGESGIVYDECSLVDKVNKVIIITAYYSTDMIRSNIMYNYFEGSKVETWQLKYCLDNDTSRFVWADNTQQITNLRSACSEGRPLTRQPAFDNRNTNPNYLEYQYAWGTSDDVFDGDNTNFIYSKNETVENDELVLNMSIYGDEELQNAQVEERGKGVIYYLKDEFENECSYDFKNIQFARYKITECENCDMLVDKYYGVISNQSYEKLLPDFLDFDDNDYKYFYTFDLYQTDYSLNAIGRTFTRPDGSSFTLDQIQCCKCVLKDDEADSSKFYLSNNVVLLESSRDCRLVVNGWCTSNTFLGGCGGIDFFNVYGNIIGATSTDFIDGYVGYNSHINRISNSLIISHNNYALTESKIGEIRDSCLIGGNRGTIAVSDVTTIEHCVLSSSVAVIAQSHVGVLHGCNIKCTDIAITQSSVQVAYYLSGEGATNFFYRSIVGFVNNLSMSTNDIARPFINRGNIQYIYEGSFKYIADSDITSLLYSNLQIVNGCKFIHNSYLTCDQDLVGCNFDHDVSFLNISSTDTTQTITNTNFHDIRGVDVDNIKNIVIPEDYSTIHTVDIYGPGHQVIEIA